MPDLDEVIERLRGMAARPADGREWYRFEAKADTRRAELRIYDEIGWFGTSARTFAQDLAALDVDNIDLYLNSVGGDAWDGVAIFNSLRRHKAKVHVVVDAIAASAASIIAMAGDTVRMNRGSQMMIHDAWGMTIGNAAQMEKAAEELGKLSAGMADIYAGRAGGTSEEWRTAMAAESWYTATEAVDAGLADSTTDDDAATDAQAKYDLKVYAFAYAGRDAAPAPKFTPRRPAAVVPKPPAAPAPGTAPQEGAGQMDPAKLREALGLPADSPDSEVTTALVAAQASLTAPTPPATPPAPPAVEPPPAAPKPVASSVASGTMTIDVSAWQGQQERMQRLEAQAARQQRDERDKVIGQAVTDGKFAPARKEHWAKLWDADPEGTRQTIDSLAKGVVPLAELGYGVGTSDEDIDREFASLFPTERKGL
jgi:ATP-dependent protease ClpP protease subunit